MSDDYTIRLKELTNTKKGWLDHQKMARMHEAGGVMVAKLAKFRLLWQAEIIVAEFAITSKTVKTTVLLYYDTISCIMTAPSVCSNFQMGNLWSWLG